MIKAWVRCWEKELTQERIQAWISRIPRHIQQIIELKGGNEYREGRAENSAIRPYNSKERKERCARRKAGFRLGDDDVDESVNQADEPDVEVEEIEVIEKMIIDRQMEGLGSKSVLSASSANTRLHVNYSVAWSWHSENIARHAPYQLRIDAGELVENRRTLVLQVNSQAKSTALKNWVQKMGTHAKLATAYFDTTAADPDAEAQRALNELEEQAKENL